MAGRISPIWSNFVRMAETVAPKRPGLPKSQGRGPGRITAFFIPEMLRKGTIDMLLAKPIHRATLLVCKDVGGLTFVLLSSAIAIGGVWLVLGLRSGIWSPQFLLVIPITTFFFAILYSV